MSDSAWGRKPCVRELFRIRNWARHPCQWADGSAAGRRGREDRSPLCRGRGPAGAESGIQWFSRHGFSGPAGTKPPRCSNRRGADGEEYHPGEKFENPREAGVTRWFEFTETATFLKPKQISSENSHRCEFDLCFCLMGGKFALVFRKSVRQVRFLSPS
jgi:hypothetical protein